jgi:hypothetical protein
MFGGQVTFWDGVSECLPSVANHFPRLTRDGFSNTF